MERKRLVADRFWRIWQIVEHVAREPGKTRRELAENFCLSERQVQADLNVIRSEMALPLVRKQGYRFLNQEGGPATLLELQEAQVLLMLVRKAQADGSVPAMPLQRLIDRLPTLFPPHLQPLIGKMIQSGRGRRRQQECFETLLRAILNGENVRLQLVTRSRSSTQDPEMRPSLLLPYLDTWYLIGTGLQRNRLMMVELETIDAVLVD